MEKKNILFAGYLYYNYYAHQKGIKYIKKWFGCLYKHDIRNEQKLSE